jgi:hypothetical protein
LMCKVLLSATGDDVQDCCQKTFEPEAITTLSAGLSLILLFQHGREAEHAEAQTRKPGNLRFHVLQRNSDGSPRLKRSGNSEGSLCLPGVGD